jgi:hypothetical protein
VGAFQGLKGVFPLTSGEPQCTGVRALAAAKLKVRELFGELLDSGES